MPPSFLNEKTNLVFSISEMVADRANATPDAPAVIADGSILTYGDLDAFGVDMALRTLFDAPSIAELSSEIERLILARVENMSEEEAQALLA